VVRASEMGTRDRYAYHADVVSVEEDLGKFRCRARVVTVIVGQCRVEGCVPCE
jgi:hypothetical protein